MCCHRRFSSLSVGYFVVVRACNDGESKAKQSKARLRKGIQQNPEEEMGTP